MEKKSIWNRSFLLLLLSNICIATSFYMLNTTLAKYAAGLGGSTSAAGFVSGIFSVSSLLARPVCGPLVDRLDRKKIYLTALIFVGAPIFLFGFVNSIYLLLALRLIQGLGWAFTTTVGITMASSSAPEGKLGECVSTYALSNVAAMAIGPSIGMYVSGGYGFRAMTFVCTFCLAMAFLLICLVPAMTNNGRVREFQLSFDAIFCREALLLTMIILANCLIYSSVSTFLNLYGDEKGIANIGLFFTVYAFVMFFARLFMGRIVDRFGLWAMIFPGALCMSVGCLLLSQMNGIVMALAAAVVFGIGYGPLVPVIQSQAFRRVSSDRRGVVSSTTSIGNDLGTGLGSSVAGVVAGLLGYSGMYLFMILFALFSVVIYLIDRRKGYVNVAS